MTIHAFVSAGREASGLSHGANWPAITDVGRKRANDGVTSSTSGREDCSVWSGSEESASFAAWPELTISQWADTRDNTLQLWTPIVGKIRLSLEPMLNHWWQVPLYRLDRGLTTSLMHIGARGIEIEFDFLEHVPELAYF